MYQPETVVDTVIGTGTRDQKIRTPDALQAPLAGPCGTAHEDAWLHESLLDEAHRLWKIMSTALYRR